jgi:N-acetylglutamate synthase-like GNAT family acetyltransferase
LIIREATPADATAISRLLDQLGYDAPVDMLVQKLRCFESAMLDAAFVASEASTILGCISIHAQELFHAKGRLGRITSLIVDEEHRGAGVGRTLVGYATALFREFGCTRIEVTSGDHRHAAHAFYAAMDFVKDERRFVLRL